MKKTMFTALLFLFGIMAFGQQKENGTIYIAHPYIDVVMKTSRAYETQDWAALKKIYSDTARWWVSGLEKFIPIADAFKSWKSDFDFYNDIKQVQVGYPDFLHYKKENAMIVQSWWNWTGKSKKTGEELKVPMVIFDEFNSAGKIVNEYIYGDFSKMEK